MIDPQAKINYFFIFNSNFGPKEGEVIFIFFFLLIDAIFLNHINKLYFRS